MEQHITNLILEMIGEDRYKDIGYTNKEIYVFEGINKEKARIRKQVPDLVTKIINLMEYNKK